MADNITEFPGAKGIPENPIQLAPTRTRFCNHDKLVIDAHARAVACADCGAALDPFDFLLKNAITLQRAWASYRQVSTEASEIADRVSVLKKEEARLRAMVKRLQEKSGAVVHVGGRAL